MRFKDFSKRLREENEQILFTIEMKIQILMINIIFNLLFFFDKKPEISSFLPFFYLIEHFFLQKLKK